MASEKSFELRVITPDRVFYEGSVQMVEMDTREGAIGVYKSHVPTTCILRPGILTLHGGFVEILKESVTVLAEAAEWPGEIDVERAEQAKERAETRLQAHNEDLDPLRAEMALRRAITRIKAAK